MDFGNNFIKGLITLWFKLLFKILIKSHYGLIHIVCKNFILSNSTTFNPYCLFRNFWANFIYDLSTPQYFIHLKNDICGITPSRKTWSFLRKNLLDLIALAFSNIFKRFCLEDNKIRHILSLTRFFIILMKNEFNMTCVFFQTKSYHQKTTQFDLHCDWKEIWSFFLKEQSNGLICVVFFGYYKQFLMKKRKVLTHLK